MANAEEARSPTMPSIAANRPELQLDQVEAFRL